MDLKQLRLIIGGDATGATNALNSIGKLVKTVIAGAAVAAMTKWVDTTIKLGMEAEAAGNLLEGTMKRTLSSTNEQVAAVKEWATQQEKVNHFDGEELMAQLDKAIVKYGDLGTAQVAVSAAQEVARWKNMDVAAAYDLVSKGANGMAVSLKLFGIQAVAGTTQLEYLQQILEKAKGSTDDYNKSTVGMVEGMKLSYETMRETLGQALLPLVNTLMTKLSPIIEGLTQYILDNMPQIQSAISKACDAIEKAFETAGKIISDVADSIRWIINHAGEAIDWINRTRTANELRAATNASAGDDFNITGMLTPNPGTNSVGTPLNIAGGRGTINREAVVADIKKVAVAYTGVAVAAVDSGIAATKASTAGADAAKKLADAAKAAAEAIKQARQGVADKIYALTHSELETELRVLEQERVANIKAGVTKLAADQLYHAAKLKLLNAAAEEAKKKEEEQTAKKQEELDKRLAAEKQYNDAVVSATKKLTDQIYAATHGDAQKQAQDIANQAASSLASGVDPSIIAQYVSTMGNQMQSEAGAALTAATTLKPGQTSFTPDQLAEITRLQGNVGTSQGAVAQYLAGPLKKLGDGIDTLIQVTSGVASGVGQAINGMGGGGRMARAT